MSSRTVPVLFTGIMSLTGIRRFFKESIYPYIEPGTINNKIIFIVYVAKGPCVLIDQLGYILQYDFFIFL